MSNSNLLNRITVNNLTKNRWSILKMCYITLRIDNLTYFAKSQWRLNWPQYYEIYSYPKYFHVKVHPINLVSNRLYSMELNVLRLKNQKVFLNVVFLMNMYISIIAVIDEYLNKIVYRYFVNIYRILWTGWQSFKNSNIFYRISPMIFTISYILI